jgi:hypothetical protein
MTEGSPINQENQPPSLGYFPDMTRPVQEELIFEWHAAARPFKKRNRQYYTTVALIVFLVSTILFFAGQFLPIAVVITAAFLAYVLSSVPPQDSNYAITTYGVRIDNQLYYWEELGRFWLAEKHDQKLINLELGKFPHRLTLVYNSADEADLVEILSEVLIMQQPALTSFEKASKWLSEKVPLE